MVSALGRDWVRRHVLLGLACGAVLLVMGCGDGRVRVHGNVNFERKPLEEGFISFEPADGQGPATGGHIKNGKYDLTGDARATVGEKRVRIVGTRPTGRKIPVESPPGATTEEWLPCIPKQYNDQSTLKVQITRGQDNTHNLDLPLAGDNT